MSRLPPLDPVYGKEEIRIFLHVSAYVNDACRPNKFLRINDVHATFREIFAADPVHRSVKVGPGMLSGLKAIPVPGRAAIVVMGKLPDAERRRVVPLRGKR